MPTFKPGGTLPIILDSDANEPNPLVLTVVALSCLEARQLEEQLQDIIDTSKSTSERWERFDALISPLVLSWNLNEDYSWQALLQKLGPSDAWQLSWAIVRQIGYREKKA
jgi:hypothetical protein